MCDFYWKCGVSLVLHFVFLSLIGATMERSIDIAELIRSLDRYIVFEFNLHLGTDEGK